MTKTCPKCESKRWMTGLPMVTPGEASVCVVRNTWKEPPKGLTQVNAAMCADCGYTEFYAADPLKVWDVWSQQNR